VIAPRISKRQRQVEELPEAKRVGGIDTRIDEQLAESDKRGIRENARCFRREKIGGHKYPQPLVAAEAERSTDAIENVSAYAAAARFEPAQRAVVDVSEPGEVLLRDAAVTAQLREKPPEFLVWARR
jgi:hypothetical protein